MFLWCLASVSLANIFRCQRSAPDLAATCISTSRLAPAPVCLPFSLHRDHAPRCLRASRSSMSRRARL